VNKVRSYTIKSGDTLSEIAQAELGSSKKSFIQDILDANPGVTVENIKPRDVLILPAKGSSSETVKRHDSEAIPAGMRSHKVISGDSLWKISRKYYGIGKEEAGIERIVAANAQLNDKNSVLNIGKLLAIPK